MHTKTTRNEIDRDYDTVVVAVKTPLMPKPTTARLPARLNLRQAVEQLQRETPKDAHAARVLQQLRNEMSEVHHYLAVRPNGSLSRRSCARNRELVSGTTAVCCPRS